jgi:hypothetical protein
LLYLNYITDSENIEIPLDPFVVERLRKIWALYQELVIYSMLIDSLSY